jgi:hypothetical protein
MKRRIKVHVIAIDGISHSGVTDCGLDHFWRVMHFRSVCTIFHHRHVGTRISEHCHHFLTGIVVIGAENAG